MSLSDVQQALITAAETALGVIPIEGENITFTPPPVEGVCAQQTLHFDGDDHDHDTIVIGGVTYEYQVTPDTEESPFVQDDPTATLFDVSGAGTVVARVALLKTLVNESTPSTVTAAIATVTTSLVTTAKLPGTGGNVLATGTADFTATLIVAGCGSKWAALLFVPNTPEVETLGSAGQDKVTGFLQLDFNYVLGTGDIDARADYEAIRAAFKAGTRLTYSSQSVMITSCGRSQGRSQVHFTVNITINWYALIPR
jgi:hypothetical protein